MLGIVLTHENTGGVGAGYLKGDRYGLVEVAGTGDQENDKGQGFSTPKAHTKCIRSTWFWDVKTQVAQARVT